MGILKYMANFIYRYIYKYIFLLKFVSIDIEKQKLKIFGSPT